MSAKLWVPGGAPLQERAGEVFPPLKPMPLKTCGWGIVPPWAKSLLRSVNADTDDAGDPVVGVIREPSVVGLQSYPTLSGNDGSTRLLPVAAVLAPTVTFALPGAGYVV